jgi:hypothetical protein
MEEMVTNREITGISGGINDLSGGGRKKSI